MGRPFRLVTALLAAVLLTVPGAVSAAEPVPVAVPYVDADAIHAGDQLLSLQVSASPYDLVDLGQGRFGVLMGVRQSTRVALVDGGHPDWYVYFSHTSSVVGSPDGRRFAYVRTISGGHRVVVRSTADGDDKVAQAKVPAGAAAQVRVIGYRRGKVWISVLGAGPGSSRTVTFDVAHRRFVEFSGSRWAASMSTTAGQVALVRESGGCTGFDVVTIPRRGDRAWRLCDEQRRGNRLTWSPDGRLLLHPVYDEDAAQYTRVEVRRARTGALLGTADVGGRMIRVAWEDASTFLVTADDAEPHGADPTSAWLDRCDATGACTRVSALDVDEARSWVAARTRG